MKQELKPSDIEFISKLIDPARIGDQEILPPRRFASAVIRVSSEHVTPVIDHAHEDLIAIKQMLVAQVMSQIYGEIWVIGRLIEMRAGKLTISEIKKIGQFLKAVGQSENRNDPFNTSSEYNSGLTSSELLISILNRDALPVSEENLHA